MNKRKWLNLVVLSTLLAWGPNSFGQSTLVFHDAENTRIGELVQLHGGCDGISGDNPLFSCNVIARAGLYILGFDTQTGELNRTRFWYFSNDCTGEPRLNIEENGTRGGALVYTRRGEDPLAGVVDWGAAVSPTSLRSYWLENGSCADSFRLDDSIPITLIESPAFGVKLLPGEVTPGIKGLGFIPPIIPIVEKPDHVFCNSFESCPNE